MTLPASRPLYLISFLTCVALLLIALYMEHVMDMVPCPLCIIQRVVFVLIGLVSLAALVHNPLPRDEAHSRAAASRAYAAVITVFALFGGAVAGRQVWLQHQPPEMLPSCLPSLDYMIDVLPFRDMLGLLFSGTADCAAVTWTFLGMSIAEGTLIAFTFFTAFGLLQLFRRED